MRVVVLVLIALLALLNHQLWLSEDRGFQKVWLLKDAIKAQVTENAALTERNKTLEAEVKDLKEGLAAVEERARLEMGMVRQGETFFRILEDQPPPEPAQKPVTQKPPAQKPVARKSAAQKPTAQKPTAQKPVARKSATRKPTAQKPAAQKPPAKKPAAQKSAAQRQPVHVHAVQEQPARKPTAQGQRSARQHE
jgi:cell division protein FtsB